jgi:cupin fold WbuC family metalloprotein
VIRLIDAVLLADLSGEARLSPRGRKNRNFHPGDDFPAHRLLNAIEPGSYIAPHRHLDSDKDETIIALVGRIGLVIFDDHGGVTDTVVLTADAATSAGAHGVDIEHGTWHTVLALATGSVLFEAKAGPFRPLTAAERAPWAPQENDAGAAAYYQSLVARFASAVKP